MGLMSGKLRKWDLSGQLEYDGYNADHAIGGNDKPEYPFRPEDRNPGLRHNQ